MQLPGCSWNEQNTGLYQRTGVATDSILELFWPIVRKASSENFPPNQNQLQSWVRTQFLGGSAS